MVDIIVAPAAWRALEVMCATHRLPETAKARVAARIRSLSVLPERGRPLEGRWAGFRYILGPWPWLLIVYTLEDDPAVIQVVAFHDARRASSATSRRSG